MAKPFYAAACSDAALTTLRLAVCQPGCPADSAPAVPPVTTIWANPAGAPV